MFVAEGEANGDISGDESISSDHQDQHDENSMDSERGGGALNLVSFFLQPY